MSATTYFSGRVSALFLVFVLAAGVIGWARAQDTNSLARDLVTLKGGYAEKKRLLEELRIRAYVPILLKAVGKGSAWRPGHPNWADTEQRIAGEWRKLYASYLARVGRDTNYQWMDAALTSAYAQVFSAGDLEALLRFYRSDAGTALIALEKPLLEPYMQELVRSLTRVLLGADLLTEREQAALRSPDNRLRRDFVEVFEAENVYHDEILRIGSRYIEGQQALLQQGALATTAATIDSLRGKLDATAVQEILAFVKSPLARRERAFLLTTLPAAIPVAEDPAQTAAEEAAFYKELAQRSAEWQKFAAR